MNLYFVKRVIERSVEDSTEGYTTLNQATDVILMRNYDVIEERKDATSDDPLSGELVQSHPMEQILETERLLGIPYGDAVRLAREYNLPLPH
jgi:hypothetical protein